MMSTKVSMVMPCYNKESYIGDTLQSVCNQIWDNIEVILVNDGSTDGTVNVIAEWEPKLKVRGYEVIIVNQKNAGLAAAIKSGLKHVSGDYVCFPDSDDEMLPEYVSAMAEALDIDHSADFAACEMGSRKEQGGNIVAQCSIDKITNNTTIEQVLLQRVHPSVCVYLVRMEYARKYDLFGLPDFFTLVQEPFILVTLYGNNGKLVKIDSVLYIYNIFSSELAGGCGQAGVNLHYQKRYLYYLCINKLSTPDEEKKRMMKFAAIGCQYVVNGLLSGFESGNEIFFRAITSSLLGLKPTEIQLDKRIIAYGALGKEAGMLLPQLKGTPLWPCMFWDRAAQMDSVIFDGSPVTCANLEMIKPGDILLCLPKIPEVFDEVAALATKHDTLAFSWNDVINYLASWYYSWS